MSRLGSAVGLSLCFVAVAACLRAHEGAAAADARDAASAQNVADARGAATRSQGRRLYPVNVDGRHAFIDETGKLAFTLPPEVYTVSRFSEGLAVVAVRVAGTRGRWGFIDEAGRTVIPPRFHHASPFAEGLAAVMSSDDESSSGLLGYVGRDGRVVIAPRFARSTGGDHAFSEGLAAAQSMQDMSWGYIDRTGGWAVRPRFAEAHDFSEGLALVAVGQTMVGGKYEPDLKYGFVDASGRVVIPLRFANADSFSEGLAAFQAEEGGRVGYMDRGGKVAVSPQFGDGGPRCGSSFQGYSRRFSEGLAAVRVGEKFGYIDRAGKLAVAAQYDCAAPFSEGLALVGLRTDHGARYGYIDRGGGVVVEPRFSAAASFSGPLALVGVGLSDEEATLKLLLEKEAGKSEAELQEVAAELEKNKAKYGYIDRAGKFVWQPSN